MSFFAVNAFCYAKGTEALSEYRRPSRYGKCKVEGERICMEVHVEIWRDLFEA